MAKFHCWPVREFFAVYHTVLGQVVAQLVEVMHHKTGRPGFDFAWSPWKFSSDQIHQYAFSSHGVNSASKGNEYQ